MSGLGFTVGVGAGAGCCVISNSSITAEMVSKEGDPSYFVPVLLGSLDKTKMVGVTETSFWQGEVNVSLNYAVISPCFHAG